ncbi:NAD(P)-binding protein [Aaosphaeria arxii CBS 175.79]|uniref:NAD(P)-binding protein n=1 Tax=Aaosphaeria arxii CBS 175.79 TaxID=1450172 RepID=A0A6A5XNM3_9PLEO|nr:NAD(P)-binding protein [Aaosphaeria arxii CBS 175.79]KAF2014506.1 NAD(P)-binding protein [Aaosphaeria arxii CBS 175.79]
MSSIDQPLKGKILLITGGASGIGLSLAHQSHSLGARLLISDLHPTPALTTLLTAHPSTVLFVQSDVTRWSDLASLFAACEAKWGDVPDAYGICAGLFEPPFSSWWLDTEEQGYKQCAVNVEHPVKLTRMAIKKSLGRGKRASVCIISSIGGIAGSIAAPLYCATKHAIVGFVKSLKDTEPLTGVKVTGICPGLVNTPLFTSDKKSQFSFAETKALSPDDVASNMLRLLQEKEFPCGTLLQLDMAGAKVLPEWGIPEPTGEGTGKELEAEDMTRALLGPIREKLEQERGSKL